VYTRIHEWHAKHDISYVTANLIALKEPMERNAVPTLGIVRHHNP